MSNEFLDYAELIYIYRQNSVGICIKLAVPAQIMSCRLDFDFALKESYTYAADVIRYHTNATVYKGSQLITQQPLVKFVVYLRHKQKQTMKAIGFLLMIAVLLAAEGKGNQRGTNHRNHL